ncbi:MAG: CsbD family protein [Candidatus Dormibacteria bacterium]
MPGRKDEAAGTVKKAVGKATGDRNLSNEGRAQNATGAARRKGG